MAGELDFGEGTPVPSSTSNEAFSSSEFEIDLREGLPLPSTLATFRDVAIPLTWTRFFVLTQTLAGFQDDDDDDGVVPGAIEKKRDRRDS